MLKALKCVSAAVVTMSMAFAAHADINTSLHNVCENAKQQSKPLNNNDAKSSRVTYQTKLVNYYAGVSCQGKSLIHTSLNNKQKSAENLVDKGLPTRF